MINKYDWEQYLAIEDEFIQAKKYLSFDRQSNLDADSPFLHNEIVLLGSKVEIAMKVFIKNGCDGKIVASSISDYKRILLVMVPEIENYYVSLIGIDAPPIRPFYGWSTSALTWWSAYSAIKHGSTSRLPKLEHGLNLLAAYLILLHLIHVLNAKKKNEFSAEYDFIELPKLFRLGFEGTRIFNTERPFLFGFDVSNYHLCENMEAISSVIHQIEEEKKAGSSLGD